MTDKYRPKTFKGIVGQAPTKKQLEGIVTSGKYPALVLLCGPWGTGKTSLARILARRANCLNPNGVNPCLKCDSCKLQNHPDITELNAADKRGIDDIRHLIDVSRLSPRFKHRFYIIDEAHMLTPQAAQASLKLFEEPAQTTSFVMITTEQEKLPKTLLSRARQLKFNRVPIKMLSDRILQIAKREDASYIDDKTAKTIAEFSMGHPRDAIKVLEQLVSAAGDGEVSKDLLDQTVKDVVKEHPRMLVKKFVAAVVNENLKQAYYVASKSPDADFLLRCSVDMLQALVKLSVEPALVDQYHRKQLEGIRSTDVTVAAQLLKVFAKAFRDARTYAVPADVLLDIAIAESSTL